MCGKESCRIIDDLHIDVLTHKPITLTLQRVWLAVGAPQAVVVGRKVYSIPSTPDALRAF